MNADRPVVDVRADSQAAYQWDHDERSFGGPLAEVLEWRRHGPVAVQAQHEEVEWTELWQPSVGLRDDLSTGWWWERKRRGWGWTPCWPCSRRQSRAGTARRRTSSRQWRCRLCSLASLRDRRSGRLLPDSLWTCCTPTQPPAHKLTNLDIHTHASNTLYNLVTLTFDLAISGQCAPKSCRMCTEFGVDSSSRLSFRARTHRQTKWQTLLITVPTHAKCRINRLSQFCTADQCDHERPTDTTTHDSSTVCD